MSGETLCGLPLSESALVRLEDDFKRVMQAHSAWDPLISVHSTAVLARMLGSSLACCADTSPAFAERMAKDALDILERRRVNQEAQIREREVGRG